MCGKLFDWLLPIDHYISETTNFDWLLFLFLDINTVRTTVRDFTMSSCVLCNKDNTSGRPQSKATRRLLLQCFYHNLRHLPQLIAGVGATPIPLNTQLVLSSTGIILPTMNGWKAERTFGAYGNGHH